MKKRHITEMIAFRKENKSWKTIINEAYKETGIDKDVLLQVLQNVFDETRILMNRQIADISTTRYIINVPYFMYLFYRSDRKISNTMNRNIKKLVIRKRNNQRMNINNKDKIMEREKKDYILEPISNYLIYLHERTMQEQRLSESQ